MSSIVSLDAPSLDSFTVPYSLRLLGDKQHLLGCGSVCLATNLRMAVLVRETAGAFSLSFGGVAGDDDFGVSGVPGRLPWPDEISVSRFPERWRNALGRLVPDPSVLEGLDVEVDLGPLWAVCPVGVLLSCPSLAAALAAVVAAHRMDPLPPTDAGLAGVACRVLSEILPAGPEDTGGAYGEALMSLVGGAGYVEPGGERLNVQQLMPPESLLLCLMPGVGPAVGAAERDQALREALAAAGRVGCDFAGDAEEALSGLFGLGPDVISEAETVMVYGLLRARQMIESFLEYLGDPFVDNDRLAEICDEESAILTDYFAFPADVYEKVRGLAAEAGALGAKLTRAFGGYPAAVVLAPGCRQEVQEALRGELPGAHLLPINVDPTGLLRQEEGPNAAGAEPWDV